MSAISSRSVAVVTALGVVAAMAVATAPAASATTATGGRRCTIVGTAGDDRLVGTSRGDVICGLGGDDIITGAGGADVIDGGSGDDSISGGVGDDVLAGGLGDDVLVGQTGDDVVSGDDGADVVDGGAGDDRVVGGTGDDDLSGGSGDDVLVGSGGDDGLSGQAGDDTLSGGAGDDTCDRDATDVTVMSCLYDAEPPVFTHVQVLTPVVDLDAGQRTVRFRANVTDEVSGIRWVSGWVQKVDGESSSGAGASCDLVSGLPTRGVVECTMTLGTAVQPGTWTVHELDATDFGGNNVTQGVMWTDDSQAPDQRPLPPGTATFTVRNAKYDGDAPVLTDVTVDQPSYDVTGAGAVLTGTFQLSDIGSGIREVQVDLARGAQFASWTKATRVSGSLWTWKAGLLADVADGEWTIGIAAFDTALNRSAASTTVDIVSRQPDTTAPVVTAVKVVTPVVTKRTSLEAQIRVTIRDDHPLQWDRCPQLVIATPRGKELNAAIDSSIVASSSGGRAITCLARVDLPPALAAGTYRLVGIFTTDTRFNTAAFWSGVQVDAWPWPADQASPVLVPIPSFVVR